MSQGSRVRVLGLASIALAGSLGVQGVASAETIYGLGGAAAPALVNFDSATPGTVNSIGFLTGVPAGFSVMGIDFRPATGQLYGIAMNQQLSQLQLCTINTATAAVTMVGTPTTVQSLDTGSVSMDFNPTVDRARVVTGDRFNLRFNPNDGSLAGQDTNLAWAAGDPLSTAPAPFISGIAYTNNTAGASTTTLLAFEHNQRYTARIGGVDGSPSPNLGAVSSIGPAGLSPLQTTDVGLDVSGVTGIAYISLPGQVASIPPAESGEGLYTVNGSTGALTFVGGFGAPVRDISVAPAPLPEPASLSLGAAVATLLLRRRR